MKTYTGFKFSAPLEKTGDTDLVWYQEILDPKQFVILSEQLSKIKIIPATVQKFKGLPMGRDEEGGVVNLDVRKSRISWIDYSEDNRYLFERLEVLIAKANREANWNFKIDGLLEPLQYAVYDTDDYYQWHLDLGWGPFANRKITGIIPLNDDYKGGEVEVHCTNGLFTLSRQVNTLNLFPSYLLHRVKPITSGTRRSLVFWVAGPPFK